MQNKTCYMLKRQVYSTTFHIYIFFPYARVMTRNAQI